MSDTKTIPVAWPKYFDRFDRTEQRHVETMNQYEKTVALLDELGVYYKIFKTENTTFIALSNDQYALDERGSFDLEFDLDGNCTGGELDVCCYD